MTKKRTKKQKKRIDTDSVGAIIKVTGKSSTQIGTSPKTDPWTPFPRTGISL